MKKTVICIRILVLILGVCFFEAFYGTSVLNENKIVVTSASNLVNGDVFSIEALKANPGPDGISLREAILAGNTTSGQKNIEFSDKLMGKTIFVAQGRHDDPFTLPSLLSGNYKIKGDIDGDEKPDITLNGKHMSTAGIMNF